VVRRGATIGANATIICGAILGQYCFVAAGAVVTCDVPDYALVMGVPAIQAGWVCVCGDRLRETNEVNCSSCGRHYVIEDDYCRELTHTSTVAA
jgi:UDP-2-acetamido-3-amino-2,3-dideoxy-glucuronate N-acetyltransferase